MGTEIIINYEKNNIHHLDDFALDYLGSKYTY